MIRYTYLAPDGGERREAEFSDSEAGRMIGARALMGFDLTQRTFRDRDGEWTCLVYFQSEITGDVWAIYCHE